MSSIGAVRIDPHGLQRLPPDRLERALGPLAEAGRVDELVLILGARGVEAYYVCRDPSAAAAALGTALAAIAQGGTAGRPRVPPGRCEGAEAVRRLFRLAAGLEDAAAGAEEVRRALRMAERAGTVGAVLRHLCTEALRAAGRARQCGGLGAGLDQPAGLVEEKARRFDAEGAHRRVEGRFEVIDGQAGRLDVVVLRLVSPLDTGSIHGRGHGVLDGDRGVEVTFLLDQSDFVGLRERLLRRDGDVRFSVPMNDVTAIDARGRPALV